MEVVLWYYALVLQQRCCVYGSTSTSCVVCNVLPGTLAVRSEVPKPDQTAVAVLGDSVLVYSYSN